jgi:hypothetical protein
VKSFILFLEISKSITLYGAKSTLTGTFSTGVTKK